MVNRVTPKLETINTISKNLDRLEVNGADDNDKLNGNNNRKVQFDPATVSFQVNYGGSSFEHDHRSYRHSQRHNHHRLRNSFYQNRQHRTAPKPGLSIPLWQEHLHPKKSQNIFLLLARQMTCAQWTKCLFLVFCLVEFFVQLFYLYSFHRKNYTHSSIAYRLPKQIEFPAITLCLPVIIPFNDRCMQTTDNSKVSTDPNNQNNNNNNNGNSRTRSRSKSNNGGGDADEEEEDEDEDEEEEDEEEDEEEEGQGNGYNEEDEDKDSHNNNQRLSEWCDQKDAGYLFNYSISQFGHSCKIRYSSRSPLINCASVHYHQSPLIESYFENRRCYTYNYNDHSSRKDRYSISIAEYKDSYISLVIRSNQAMISSTDFVPNSSKDSIGNLKSSKFSPQGIQLPELYIHHQTSTIPIDSFQQPLTLPLNRRFNVRYHYIKQFHHDSGFYRCKVYNNSYDTDFETSSSSKYTVRQQCLDQCYLRELDEKCGDNCSPLSYRLPIRRHLTVIGRHVSHGRRQTRLCTGPNQNQQKCTDSEIDTILDTCDERCPPDCTIIETELSIDQSLLNDETETHIRLQRKMEPDYVIHQIPAMNCLRLVADIGGIFAFWLVVAFVCCKLIDLFQFGWDLWELYYL